MIATIELHLSIVSPNYIHCAKHSIIVIDESTGKTLPLAIDETASLEKFKGIQRRVQEFILDEANSIYFNILNIGRYIPVLLLTDMICVFIPFVNFFLSK